MVGDQRLQKVTKLEGKINNPDRRRNAETTVQAAAIMAQVEAVGEAIPFANHQYHN